jgi:site-specific DNA recombinase
MRLAVEMGRWTYQAPLGYLRGGRPGPSLVFDPDRADLLRQGSEWCAAGHGDRAHVLAKLTALGLRSRKGAKVSAQTFAAILGNPIYTARIELPRWRFSGPGDWEPLVSPEVFARVQKRRSATAAKNHFRQHPDFPLRVFVRCALCSTPLTGSFSKGRSARYPYYSCRKCGRVRARKTVLETLFTDRLATLQPRKEYLRLFNAIVRDVWESQRQGARDLREATQRRLHAVGQRLDALEQAFIFEKRIDRATYERQRDKLREDETLLQMELHEARVEEMDVEGLLAFAETLLADASRVWWEATPDQKNRLQRVSFPKVSVSTVGDLEPLQPAWLSASYRRVRLRKMVWRP